MDQYILWCLILILLFVLIVILKKKNYLKESFEGDLASVQSGASTSSTSTTTSETSNMSPSLATRNVPVPANILYTQPLFSQLYYLFHQHIQ